MLNKTIISSALAAACSVTLLAAQQTPPRSQPQPSPDAQATRGTTTMVGCIYREEDIPGRAPNVAERAGIGEDFIFAEAATAPPPIDAPRGAPGSVGTSGGGAGAAVGTSGAAAPMYKVEYADKGQLKSLVGKRVEAVGRVEAKEGDVAAPAPGTASSTAEKILGRDRTQLSKFDVSSFKEVAGGCSASPAAR